MNLIDKKKIEKEHVLKIQMEILEVLHELVQMSITYETIFDNDLVPLKKDSPPFQKESSSAFHT